MATGFLPIVHGVAALFALIELIMTAYRKPPPTNNPPRRNGPVLMTSLQS